MNCVYNKQNVCTVLKDRKCNNSYCTFAKTKAEHDTATQKAFDRLNTLPLEQQCYISEKYYNGKTPWVKRGDMN